MKVKWRYNDIVPAFSDNPIFRVTIFLMAYIVAAIIGRQVAQVKFIEPGLITSKTPVIPRTRASQRRKPTDSFRKTTENMVINKGATKKIAELSANDIKDRPEKKERLAITRHVPEAMCKIGRFVLRAEHPPSKGRRRKNVNINAIIARKNTT